MRLDSATVDVYESAKETFIQCWQKCITTSDHYVAIFCPTTDVIVFFVSVLVAVEMHRRHYFRRVSQRSIDRFACSCVCLL